MSLAGQRPPVDLEQDRTQRQALGHIERALALISTGLAHRDRLIREAILSELASTTEAAELRTRQPDQLDAIAETIRALGGRLTDGLAYDTLIELQVEARRLFERTRANRGADDIRDPESTSSDREL